MLRRKGRAAVVAGLFAMLAGPAALAGYPGQGKVEGCAGPPTKGTAKQGADPAGGEYKTSTGGGVVIERESNTGYTGFSASPTGVTARQYTETAGLKELSPWNVSVDSTGPHVCAQGKKIV